MKEGYGCDLQYGLPYRLCYPSPRGFTLLELLLVLTVIVIGTMAITPSYQKWAEVNELKSAIRQLLTGLKRARNEAMLTGQPAGLTINLLRRDFIVTGERSPRQLPQSVGIRLLTVQQEVVTSDIAAIRFFPDGSSTGGRITLLGKAQEYDIDIHWLTGRTILQDPHAITSTEDGDGLAKGQRYSSRAMTQ